MNRIEKALKKNDFMHGSYITSLDFEAFDSLKADEASISPLNHPRVFGWYALLWKVADARRAQFPVVEAKAEPAKKAAKAAADDDLDDLFGDDEDDQDERNNNTVSCCCCCCFLDDDLRFSE